jgi:hypothetical protein
VIFEVNFPEHRFINRLVAMFITLSMLLILMPITTYADNSTTDATIVYDGTDTSWWICYNDDCSAGNGIDEFDYFKLYVYNGDQYEVYVYNRCDPHSAAIRFGRNTGSWSHEHLDCSDSHTYSTTVSSNGYVYFYVRGLDGFFGDGTYYRLTADVDQTYRDRDADGVLDSQDDCATEYGDSWADRDGCPDTDGDGYSDYGDAFDYDDTQWYDLDDDGFGDNPNGRYADACPSEYGQSWRDRYGCPDSDNDGASDADDDWYVWEGADAFEEDGSQWSDRDGDAFGDNQASSATTPDSCPYEFGLSFHDFYGCPDWDRDGYSDDGDALPRVPTQHEDIDGDGFGDNKSSGAIAPDGCLNVTGTSREDRYGCPDSDGDGWSDADTNWPAHPVGYADAFPSQPSQWADVDEDGFGDNQSPEADRPDSCPITSGTSTEDRFGCPDRDGDGWSDLNDLFPDRVDQWADLDGDGFGDNSLGQLFDECVEVPGTSTSGRVGCPDTDLDGYDDLSDKFPMDGSQHSDIDGDGFGDSAAGRRPDSCLNSAGESWIDRFGCPDEDGDGASDEGDLFIGDPNNWADGDGDGFGDNAIGPNRDDCPSDAGTSTIDRQGCPDGNNDGYSDLYGNARALFARMGSNPFTELTTYGIMMISFLVSAAIVRGLRGRN